MTARQPRRTRRRSAPATTLPRPSTIASDSEDVLEDGDPVTAAAAARRSARRTQFRHREHHVEKDYSYVHKDLLTVLGIGVVCVGFIIGMSFFVS